jgi:UDP-N-acetylmuramoylalanine--D-glutamate ligase
MKISELRDKKILVLGLGKEGLSALEYLKKNFPENEVGTADQKNGDNYLEKLAEYDVIIKSPGIPYLPEIVRAKDSGKIITSTTDLFFDNFSGQIIGVTGTKGKSTTTSLIYEVLKAGGLDAYLVGNIGNPVLDVLDDLTENSIVVYELSSFQLSDLSKSPHIAVWTSIYSEHLDYHGSFESYFESKANITKFQTEDDYFIFNNSFPEIIEVAKTSKARQISYSLVDKDTILNGISSQLIGEFNLQNIMPAVIIGKEIFNLPHGTISKAISEFKPLPHRLEFVAEKSGIKFYNDSLATNPRATIAAIEAFGEELETLIVGGFDRGVDYSVLGPIIAKSKIKNLILFPDTGEKIWEAVSMESQEIKKFNTSSMDEAVKIAFEVTSPGKVCLMSPASASFNMFKDYADRGEQFKSLVSVLNHLENR